MKNFTFSLLILSIIMMNLTKGKYLGINEEGIDTFTIDLDEEPSKRFAEPTLKFKETIISLMKLYQDFLPTGLYTTFKIFDWIIWLRQSEHYNEIAGIAEVLEIDIHTALMLNYVYEFDSYCTSLIVKL